MKKYIIAAILSILATGFANAQQTINLLTSEKSVIWGQAYTANSVVRFPSSAQAELPAEVWAAAQRSSGLYVRFKTEATSITVNYTGSNRNANIWYLNTGNVTTGGFDMYQRNGNDWYWVRPSTVTMGSSFVFANITASGKKEYCLYLPTAISLSALSIEVTTGSVEFINVPQEFQPIVFYGATHINGIAVNRPGNTISAITGRNFINVPVVNLGLDTAAKLSVAEIAMLTAIDAQIYVLDVLPNLLSNPETIKDLYVGAVDAIVAGRPNAAVILTEHPGFADGYMSPSKNAASDAANTELAAAYSELTTKYPSSKIYYIAKGDLNLDPAVDFANDRFPNEKGTYTYAGEYADKIEDFLTTKTYNVYFVNATDTVSGGSVAYNGTVTSPANPTPPTPGHYFVGWFYNGVAYDFATPVAHDIYLRAEYTTCSPEKTITYTAEQPARDNLKSDLKALVNGGKIWTTAHRGNTYMGLQAGVPELSLPAIDSAYKYGVEIVELDPQMTSDGEMVLIHDWYEGTALNRTTTGTGHPNEYTLAELKELFLRSGLGGSGSSVTSYKIPTLGEALRHAKDKVYINLDIERYVNVGCILWYDRQNNVLHCRQQHYC